MSTAINTFVNRSERLVERSKGTLEKERSEKRSEKRSNKRSVCLAGLGLSISACVYFGICLFSAFAPVLYRPRCPDSSIQAFFAFMRVFARLPAFCTSERPLEREKRAHACTLYNSDLSPGSVAAT